MTQALCPLTILLPGRRVDIRAPVAVYPIAMMVMVCVFISGSHLSPLTRHSTVLYTTGTDNLLKAASSATGQVTSKSLLSSSDPVTTLLPLSPAHLLVGTDAGSVHLFDTRTPSALSVHTSASWDSVHQDYISSLTALGATTESTTGFARQFIATGDTTLTCLDVRKPGTALSRSEDQEDEFLSSCYVSNAPSRSKSNTERVIAGTAGGVVTVWNRGFWEDHQDRIPIARATGDSVDALMALPEGWKAPAASGGWGTYFAAGSGDGKVRVVKMGSNRIVATMAHSFSKDEAKAIAGGKVKEGDYEAGLEEGVVALGLDCDGRIISGGGEVIKVWSPAERGDEAEDAGREEKRKIGSDSDSDRDDSDADSDNDRGGKEKKKRKKKKRKGGKGKAKSVGVKNVISFAGID